MRPRHESTRGSPASRAAADVAHLGDVAGPVATYDLPDVGAQGMGPELRRQGGRVSSIFRSHRQPLPQPWFSTPMSALAGAPLGDVATTRPSRGSAPPPGFYASAARPFACRCSWQGLGRAAVVGDVTSLAYHRFGITTLHCPRCDAFLLEVRLDDPEDVLAHRELADRVTVRHAETAHRAELAWRERHLARPDQLPPVAAAPFVAGWRVVADDGLRWYVVATGGQELWREPLLTPGESWRGPDRFAAIAALLRARYGEAIADLVPGLSAIRAWAYPRRHPLGRTRGARAVAGELRWTRERVFGGARGA